MGKKKKVKKFNNFLIVEKISNLKLGLDLTKTLSEKQTLDETIKYLKENKNYE